MNLSKKLRKMADAAGKKCPYKTLEDAARMVELLCERHDVECSFTNLEIVGWVDQRAESWRKEVAEIRARHRE